MNEGYNEDANDLSGHSVPPGAETVESDPTKRPYLQEAWQEIMSENDPVSRSYLMLSAIHEGEQLADGVRSAYDSFEPNPQNPDEMFRKQLLGLHIVTALAENKSFDAAYAVAEDLKRYSSLQAAEARFKLVEEGYDGPNGELLVPPDPESVYDIVGGEKVPNRDRALEVELYVMGMAARGEDIYDPPCAELLKELGRFDRRLNPDRAAYHDRRRTNSITNTYAKHGHAKYAVGYRTGNDENFAEVFSILSANTTDSTLAEKYADELERIAKAHPDNMRAELLSAESSARLGRVDYSRKILAEYQDLGSRYSAVRLRAYLSLYEASGDEADRKAAVDLMAGVAFNIYSNMADPITRLAEADLKYHNTLPTLEEGDEVVPRVAWEVTNMSYETSAHTREMAKELFGVSISDEKLSERDVQTIIEKRSAGNCAMAIFLAKNNSPRAASEALARITQPIDRVRAKVALDHIYEPANVTE